MINADVIWKCLTQGISMPNMNIAYIKFIDKFKVERQTKSENFKEQSVLLYFITCLFMNKQAASFDPKA